MVHLRAFRPFLPLLVTGFALACSSDNDGPTDGNGGEGGGGGAEITRTIGQDGGEIETANVKVNFPAGAVPKNTEVTVATLDAEDVEELPSTTDGVKLAGFPAKFTPHGLTFEQPVDVVLGYEEPEDPETPLVAMKLDNDQDTTWEVIESEKLDSGEAHFKISSFSIYGVFEDPNGVADELYGPDPMGSGGTTGTGGEVGSGGEPGSGGEVGSGGEPGSGGEVGSGGEPGSGGVGGTGGLGGTGGVGGTGGFGGTGGLGGTGGTGGSPPTPGFLDTMHFQGYGYTEHGPLATISVDFANELAPNCATGTTGTSPEDKATLIYRVNQDVDFSEGPPLDVSQFSSGLLIGASTNRGLHAVLYDAVGNTWCAPLLLQDGTPEFIPWETFNEAPCGLPSEQYYDPVASPLAKVGVTVSPGEFVGESFDFCISELDAAMGLPGYLGQPGQDWFGYGSIVNDPSSVVASSDLDMTPAPNCASGTTGGDADAHAGIHYSVHQFPGQASTSVYFTEPGVRVDVYQADARQLKVELVDTTQGTTWCALVPGVGSHFIPRNAFNTVCENGSGTPLPSEVMIERAGVVAVGSGIADDPFAFCVVDLRPDSLPAPNGYLDGIDWFGQGYEALDPSSTISSDLSFAPAPNCASGTTGADPGAFAGLAYNINQPVSGTNTPTLLEGVGVQVDINVAGAQEFVVKLLDFGTSTSWCAPISGSGNQFIPYDDFNTLCDGTGTAFDSSTALIDQVAVVANGNGSPDETYDFCILDLRPQMQLPLPNGYFQNPVWHGFGFEEINGDATLTSDLATKPAAHFVSGTTGIDVNSAPAFGYAVNQPMEGGSAVPITLSHAGVWVHYVAMGTPRPYVVRMADSLDSRTWCAPLPGMDSAFVPWENFSDNCSDPPAGSPPIPGVDEIDYIALLVPSTGIEADPYAFSIINFEPMDIPPGYLNGPSWYGFGEASASGATLGHDLNQTVGPNCIGGETGASPSSSASLMYYVNQTVAGARSPILLGEDGVLIDFMGTTNREVHVKVWSEGADLGFCAVLPSSPGPHFVPWTTFNETCWTTGGTPFDPGSLAIDQIGVVVPSTGIADDPYSVCITQLEAMSIPE